MFSPCELILSVMYVGLQRLMGGFKAEVSPDPNLNPIKFWR